MLIPLHPTVFNNYYIKKLSDGRFEILNILHDKPCYRIIELSNKTYVAYHLLYNNAMLGNYNSIEEAYKYCTGESYDMSGGW